MNNNNFKILFYRNWNGDLDDYETEFNEDIEVKLTKNVINSINNSFYNTINIENCKINDIIKIPAYILCNILSDLMDEEHEIICHFTDSAIFCRIYNFKIINAK